MKLVVIPDIHGRYDALTSLLVHGGAVNRELNWAGSDMRVCQLGDLIDRGPWSRECVELMMRLQLQSAGRVVVLKGNHEAMLLEAVASQSGAEMARWIANGAGATLESYGGSFDKLCRPGGAHHGWLRDLP